MARLSLRRICIRIALKHYCHLASANGQYTAAYGSLTASESVFKFTSFQSHLLNDIDAFLTFGTILVGNMEMFENGFMFLMPLHIKEAPTPLYHVRVFLTRACDVPTYFLF